MKLRSHEHPAPPSNSSPGHVEALVVAVGEAAAVAHERQQAMVAGIERRIDDLRALVKALGETMGPKLEVIIRQQDRDSRALVKLDSDIELVVTGLRGIAQQVAGKKAASKALSELNSRRPAGGGKKGRRQ